jgi:peptide/nickel transport system ATP-binding protein
MLVEAKNVCFSYDKQESKSFMLNNICFGIDAGERVALIGPSGCGKSTLSHILAGYLEPQAGEVLFGGKPLPAEGTSPVQLIYQHPEKAVNPRWKLRATLNEAWLPDDAFLAEMGIAPEWLDRYPTELSGGELQRFCIARALCPSTQVLIADEISTMLDVITQVQIWETVLDLAEKRKLGLLVVTHSAELASHICSRVVEFESLQTAAPRQ